MTKRIADISLRKAALVAGFGYLIIFIFSTFANFFLENLGVLGDVATIANNIMASGSLFRMGIASWLIVLIAEVVVAWALYVFLKPVSKSLSLLTAWFRLVYTTIIGITLLNLFNALQTGQLQAQVMLFLNAYEYGFNIGFVFFGLHIFGLGYLIFKSDYIPRILGVLLMIASLGYLIDSFASVLSSNYANNAALFLLFVAVPAVIAEFSLTLWLLIKGARIPEMKNQDETPAEKTEAKTEEKPAETQKPEVKKDEE